MLTALLIDDQKKELEGIRMLLNWAEYGIQIVGEALNGRDGLRLMEQLQPDIIITDIVMPDMDGLGLLAEIMARGLPVKVICISCFNESKFINLAINSGASGYVLKPILARELENVVRRVSGELMQLRKNQAIVGHLAKPMALQRMAAAALLCHDTQMKDFAGMGFPDQFRVGFSDTAMDLGEDALVLQYGKDGYVHFFLHEGVQPDPAMGLSAPCTPDTFDRALEQAMDDFDRKLGSNGEVSTEYIPEADLFRLKFQAREVIAQRDEKAAAAFAAACLPPMPVSALFGRARDVLVVVHTQAGSLFPHETHQLASFQEAILHCRTRAELLAVFAEYFRLIFSQGVQSDAQQLVFQLQKRIQERLADTAQLDMNALLKGIYVTPGHANVLFKHETGMTINQYIRTEKMDYAAKLLLSRPHGKINDIAEACGFADTAYFINVFKKHYGCTPAHFRAVRRGNAGDA